MYQIDSAKLRDRRVHKIEIAYCELTDYCIMARRLFLRCFFFISSPWCVTELSDLSPKKVRGHSLLFLSMKIVSRSLINCCTGIEPFLFISFVLKHHYHYHPFSLSLLLILFCTECLKIKIKKKKLLVLYLRIFSYGYFFNYSQKFSEKLILYRIDVYQKKK